MRKNWLLDGLAVALACICADTAADVAMARSAAPQYTEKTLHGFCSRPNCTDGNNPDGGLTMDSAGVLYGTTIIGGKAGEGTAFKFVPQSGRYSTYILHNFDNQNDDLAGPMGNLVIATNGALYGTASGSFNSSKCGAVYQLQNDGNGWAITVLHYFGSGNDGCGPTSGLAYAGQAAGRPWDGSSPLFGTTSAGGRYGNGIAFELTVNGLQWTETVIHNFQTSSLPNALLEDSSGNLWGTTQSGGKYGGGLMFRLASGTWNEAVLHNFCNTGNCSDGIYPLGRLVMDSAGNVYGTTSKAGNSNNSGVIFERSTGGTYSVLYSFCALTNCADGGVPQAGLAIDGSGNLFGTTTYGGNSSRGGVVFELSHSGSSWTEAVIHDFCSKRNCSDGSDPEAELLLDSSGDVFGTAFANGSQSDNGTAFELVP